MPHPPLVASSQALDVDMAWYIMEILPWTSRTSAREAAAWHIPADAGLGLRLPGEQPTAYLNVLMALSPPTLQIPRQSAHGL